MLFSTKIRRTVSLGAVLALSVAAAACDSDPTGGEDHAEVAAVRVTIGAQTTTVTDAGAQTGGITVAQGTHTVAVAYLDDGGQAITDLEQGLSLEVVPAAGTTGATFTTTGMFGGTLVATTPGIKTLQVSLMHNGHPDFRQNVQVTVQ